MAWPRGQLAHNILKRLGLHASNFTVDPILDDYITHALTRLAVGYRTYHILKNSDFKHHQDSNFIGYQYINEATAASRLALRLGLSARGGRGRAS